MDRYFNDTSAIVHEVYNPSWKQSGDNPISRSLSDMRAHVKERLRAEVDNIDEARAFFHGLRRDVRSYTRQDVMRIVFRAMMVPPDIDSFEFRVRMRRYTYEERSSALLSGPPLPFVNRDARVELLTEVIRTTIINLDSDTADSFDRDDPFYANFFAILDRPDSSARAQAMWEHLEFYDNYQRDSPSYRKDIHMRVSHLYSLCLDYTRLPLETLKSSGEIIGGLTINSIIERFGENDAYEIAESQRQYELFLATRNDSSEAELDEEFGYE